MKKIISLFLLLALSSTFLVGCDRLIYPHYTMDEDKNLVHNGKVYQLTDRSKLPTDGIVVNCSDEKIGWITGYGVSGMRNGGPLYMSGYDDDIAVLYVLYYAWIREDCEFPILDSDLSSVWLQMNPDFPEMLKGEDSVRQSLIDFQSDGKTYKEFIDTEHSSQIEKPYEQKYLYASLRDNDDFLLRCEIYLKDDTLYIFHSQDETYYPIKAEYQAQFLTAFKLLTMD